MKDILNLNTNVEYLKTQADMQKVEVTQVANFANFVSLSVANSSNATSLFTALKAGYSNYPLPVVSE